MANTDSVGVAEPRPAARTEPSRQPAGRPRPGWVLGAIAAGWLVAVLATVAHVAWLLPLLAVGAVGSLLRTGRQTLDRLVLAGFLVAGALVAGGLLFSLWPWGIDPVPVAGTLFTVIALAGWAAGRRPRLPFRFAPSDLVIAGTGLFVLLAEVRPVRRVPIIGRFALSATSEDRAAHFALFDTIHRLGSYPFLDQAAARVSVQTPAEATYPAGSHLLYALVDTFLRSTANPGPSVAAFNRYFSLVLAGYALMLTVAVWAARWVLTPLVAGWRLVATTAMVSAVLIGSSLMVLVLDGFDSQVLGIAFLALTTATAVHPPVRYGERLLFFGAGTILIAYTYYLYLPLVAVILVASLLADRRLVRRAWRRVLVAALPVAVVAGLPLYFAATSKLSLATQALANGASVEIPYYAVFGATVASLAYLFAPAGWRLRRVRVVSVLIPGTAAVILLFGIYQKVRLGRTGYYFDKFLTGYLVLAIICAATLALFVAPQRTMRPGWRGRGSQRVLGVLAVLLALTAVAGFGVGPNRPGVSEGWNQSSLGVWYRGGYHPQVATAVSNKIEVISRRGMLADGTTTMFLVSNDAYINWRLSFLNGVLNRNGGATMGAINAVLKIRAGGQPLPPAALAAAIAQAQDAVAANHGPVRIVVGDPATGRAMAAAMAARPDLPATVVPLSTW